MEVNKPDGIGVAVIIIKDGRILLGKRKGSHGAGSWAPSGGKIEKYESFEKCAKREVKEETNLDVELSNDKPFAVTNDIFEDLDIHYITLFFRAKNFSGELKLMEPESCEEWRWFSEDEVPENLFLPVRNLIKLGYGLF